MQKVTQMQEFVPLCLSAGAFAVYEGLSDCAKEDYAKLKSSLQTAFSLNQFSAYEEFVNRKLTPGETVDVYAADLQRLAGLVDGTIGGECLKCALVYGLPDMVRKQLSAACSLETMNLNEVVSRARTLVDVQRSLVGAVATAQPRNTRRQERTWTCFKCGRDGHIARNCLKLGSNLDSMTCFACGGKGHMARMCLKMAKNE